jgi:hypothetical protein
MMREIISSITFILSSIFSLIISLISPGYSDVSTILIDALYTTGKPLLYGYWQNLLDYYYYIISNITINLLYLVELLLVLLPIIVIFDVLAKIIEN